ncbi:putative PEP-CTERM domain-containing protein [Rubrivivax sp. A210]|nr:putative PEP-CTERM domain-containing protein [Rubrivivax sp. A210]
MISNAVTWLRSTMLLAAVAAAPAQAAIYTGVWDPAFGAPFTNLGWRGSATFTVPGACTAPRDEEEEPLAVCAAATVSNARVFFYDIRNAARTTIATLTFADGTLPVSAISPPGGPLSAIATNLSPFLNPVAEDPTFDLSPFAIGPNTAFALQFTLSGGPQLHYRSPLCTTQTSCNPTGTNDATTFPVQFAITLNSVPAPATPWLAGTALLGLLALRRRSAVL